MTEKSSDPKVGHEEGAGVTSREAASPYSTGGGGVTFERKVAVQYLAHLLVGDAAVELGDGRTVVSVAFQQAPNHPVDDLVVRAGRPDEAEPSLVLSIGVRRAPDLVQSDEATQKLIREFVRAVITTPTDGPEHRFALIVAGPQAHAEQLSKLAELAAVQMNASAYFDLVYTPKKFTAGVRDRLDQIQGLVKHALIDLGLTHTEPLIQQRTWELLARLTVLMPRLESPDESDWMGVQNSLVHVACGTDLAGASRLRDRLVALADEYPPKAATIDLTLLRRAVHTALDTTARRHKQGWQALNHLHERALAFVRNKVTSRDGIRFVHVDRSESESALLTTIANGAAIVVHGESGVGKSALVLSSVTAAATADPFAMQALCINLRQLPSKTVNFETTLGCPLATLLGELSAPQRCLVIDSADAIAEGMVDSFRYLIDAARTSGVKVIAVSAGDSKQIVHDTIIERFEMGVEEYTVTPLTDAEVDSIVATFTELGSLSANTRSRDLLRRLVVVDLLVRGGVAGVPLNDADAMAEVWNGLVRRRGQSDRGSPDAREVALLRLANLALTGGNALDVISMLNPQALDGLRHDGLLRTSTDDPFTICPEFAHDEVRRYAVARLLLQDSDPTSKIVAAGAPRWALAAARLACQAILALPGKPAIPLRGRFTRLQAAFDGLVDAGHGERWGDVPGEALLTMSNPGLVLQDAWSELRADNDSGLKRVARIIEQRHRNELGLVDIAAIEPIIIHILDDEAPWESDHVANLLRNWLRAHVAANTSTGHLLRIRLRERLVAACHTVGRRLVNTEVVLELLALVGPDLDERGEAFLRRVGQDAPWRLAPAVENRLTGHALVSLGRGLLAELTEAYYIDEDNDSRVLDDGIRKHGIRGMGVSPPLAAFYRGPFMPLFRFDFRNGVEVLNRMLNHAALVRARKLATLDRRRGRASDDMIGENKTDLVIAGKRASYVGDDHVWRWYRGTAVGPYPCMSALQALERVCDQVIEDGVPLADLVKLLLNGCENLAMVGLVIGLLVRHLEAAERLLDPYLADAAIWHLEFNRVINERSGFAASSEGLVAPERRQWSLREAAMMMAIYADSERAAELRAIGTALVENEYRFIAHATHDDVSKIDESDDPDIKKQLATVRIWASCLDRDTFTTHQQGDNLYIGIKPPADAVQVLEPENEDLHRSQEALRLIVRYCLQPKRGGAAVIISDDELVADLAIARDLFEHAPALRASDPWEAPTAVAAATLEGHLLRGAEVSEDGLRFAADTVLRVGEGEASPRQHESEETYFEQGADRSAARVIPLLLLPVASSLRKVLDGADGWRAYQRAVAAGLTLGRAVANEVRLHLARGLDRVWEAPCADDGCHHEAAFRVSVETMRDCDWDPEDPQCRILELEEPVADSLSSTPDERIIFTRLDAAIRALAPAAVAGICVSSRARGLLMVLLAAQRRALLTYEHDMDSRGSHALVSARALLTLASNGDDEPIFEHIDAYADNSTLLDTFLRALSAAAEEAPSRAAAARRLWPNVIKHVLALNGGDHAPFGDRHWGSRALAALMPNAAHESSYLYREIVNQPIVWWDPVVWQSEIDIWVHAAAGDANCVDQLISFFGALSPSDQVRIGLSRVAALVLADTTEIARRSYFVSKWLIESRAHAIDAGLASEWQRVVDALVVAGVSSLAPYSE